MIKMSLGSVYIMRVFRGGSGTARARRGKRPEQVCGWRLSQFQYSFSSAGEATPKARRDTHSLAPRCCPGDGTRPVSLSPSLSAPWMCAIQATLIVLYTCVNLSSFSVYFCAALCCGQTCEDYKINVLVLL